MPVPAKALICHGRVGPAQVEAEFRPSAASAVAHHKSLLLRIQPEPGLWLQGPSGSTALPFMEALPPTSSLDGYERILFDGARGSKMLSAPLTPHTHLPGSFACLL